MANWDQLGTTGNVEDRRGMSPGGLAVGGVGGIVLFLAMVFLSSQGVDTSMLQNLVQTSPSQTQTQSSQYAGDDAYQQFAERVLGSTNDTWSAIFKAQGKTYTAPKLVLFRSATASACGGASSAMGPHYCPNDQTVYLDETFFDELKNQLGGSNSDVAQAYVIGHEVGHHAQYELGTMDQIDNADNTQSVKLELQADCYAGIWMKTVTTAGVVSQSEIKDALSAAAAVGDDHVQQTMQGRVTPEKFTHGTSAQREQWFNTGYTKGSVEACNTFGS